MKRDFTSRMEAIYGPRCEELLADGLATWVSEQWLWRQAVLAPSDDLRSKGQLLYADPGAMR